MASLGGRDTRGFLAKGILAKADQRGRHLSPRVGTRPSLVSFTDAAHDGVVHLVRLAHGQLEGARVGLHARLLDDLDFEHLPQGKNITSHTLHTIALPPASPARQTFRHGTSMTRCRRGR